MSDHYLIVNRASGGHERGHSPEEIQEVVTEAFRQEGAAIEALVIGPEELDRTLGRLVKERPKRVIVAGGDGTVQSVACHLGGTGIAMGILPMGTFNLAARDLGVPLDMEAAAMHLAKARPMPIDVLDVNGRACLCTTILGFYPEFSEVLEKRDHGGQWWKKTWKLAVGLPELFRRAKVLDLQWKTERESGRLKTKFASFVAGKYRESKGLIPAREGFQHGSLTAYIGSQQEPLEAFRAAVDFVAGRHESNEKLLVVEGRSMEIRIARKSRCKAMLDGEILYLDLPLQLTILPRHLHVLVGEEWFGS